jgi:CRP-like cAMP-binding protein
MERMATLLQFSPGETISDWDDPGEHWYRLVCGAARKCALMSDGRRQIVEFLLPGDLFGFGGVCEPRFVTEAIAVGTLIARYPRNRAERLADTDPAVGRQIREMAFAAIARLQERVLILGRTTARAKVGAFLLEMARRSSDAPSEPMVLPMSRYDIADYLALAVETVSRVLTDLRGRGAITLRGARQVWIVDRAALEEDEDLAAAASA